MKYTKFLSFANGLLRASLFALIMGVAFDSPMVALATFVILFFVSSLIQMPAGAMYGTVLETWANYIMERFWKDNAFLKRAYDDSNYVLAGRIVHIPQPGSKPNVVKNRAVWPATAVRRADTDIVYALDEYSTDPTHIPNIDSIHLSYDKQDSVLGDHMSTLDETVADDMLIKWGANATIIATTGGPGAADTRTVGPITGQAGNRLGLHPKDLSNLMIRMNADGVPKNDRCILIDDNMYQFFYDSLSDNQARDFSKYVDAANGVVGRLHGFDIYTRASVLAATNAHAIKALGSALAASDNLCSIAWQKNTVAFAIGDKKLFQNLNDALYQGDVHSALVMAGGRVRREDGKGVYVIRQGVPA